MWFTEETAGRIGRITATGVVTEFAVPGNGSDPDGITRGPDGNVWFAVRGNDRIGRITPAGLVTTFGDGITDGARPTGITTGPEGALWFTENGGNRIGRLGFPTAVRSTPASSPSQSADPSPAPAAAPRPGPDLAATGPRSVLPLYALLALSLGWSVRRLRNTPGARSR